MNKLPRIGTLVVFGVLVGSCAQIIGLGKYDTDEPATAGEGGDGGVGGTGGTAGMGGKAGSPAAGSGNPTGGASGAGGNAGSASGATGGSSGGDAGTGGSEGGTGALGGDSGAGGDAGTGGSSGGSSSGGAGTGGMAGKAGMGGSAGAGGSGGQLGCSETIEITTAGDWDASIDPDDNGNFASYTYNVSPQLTPCSDCSGPLADYLWIDFYAGGEYTGEQTGPFELGVGEEENYASCSRCVWLGVEFQPSPENSAAYFFAKSGTMDIASASDQLYGSPLLTLSGVTLEEVTIDFDSGLSTRVNGGRCLYLANATLGPPVPPEWVCPESYYVDSDCDCGCGAPDPACTSSIIGACDYCPSYGCAADETCLEVDLENNAICTGPQPWTCQPTYFGDGVDCDCGCGIVDVDCPTANAVDCDYCVLYGSCAEGSTAETCPEVIVADDNSSCL
jgi:hypothetical protein